MQNLLKTIHEQYICRCVCLYLAYYDQCCR